MPTSVLELSGGPEVLRASGLAPEDLDVLLQPAADWSLVQARISLWNLGIGLVTLVYDLSTDVVPNVSAIVPSTRGQVYALTPAVSRLIDSRTAWPDTSAAVLWGNPMYLAKVSPDLDPQVRHAIAAALTPDGLDCPLQEHPTSILRIGRHCSAVCEALDDPGVDLLLRLSGVHQVCWGAALLYDARLGRELEFVHPADRSLGLRTLEEQAERILATYHLVRLFRLRYSSVEAHLDPAASRIWQGLEENWKFPSVLSSLDDRLDVVRTLHEQLYTRLQDHRSRRLNEIVVIFTFLNLFSIALAAMTFAELQSLAFRTISLIAMFVVLTLNIVAYLLFRRWTDRR
jgi:hypothetical protein